MDMTEYKNLIQVPLGKVSADKVIVNARLINVYNGKIMPGLKIAIKGSRIAYVGTSDHMEGEFTEVIDASGMFLAPGYIDPHGHTDFSSNPIALANEILPRGTTAILSDTKSMAAALGAPGIQAMLDMTEQLPLKFFFSIPAANPIIPHIEGDESLSMDEFISFINDPRALSVGELVGWVRAIDLDEELLSKLNLVRRIKKRIEGHAAGCSPETLNALINTGITSCHESITPAEIEMRLSLGLYAMLRHGSIRSDMETLAQVITEDPGCESRWMMLTPDWFSPGDILNKGYMDYLVAEAIRSGIPPVKAIQMATINPAQYLGLDRAIGGIGPSRHADILFLEDPARPAPVKVMVNGEIIAEKGKLIRASALPRRRFKIDDWRPGRVFSTQAVAEHFAVETLPANREYKTVPVIKIVNRTITKLEHAKLPVASNRLQLNSPDMLKISMVHLDRRRFVTAFLTGYGASVGGLATSTAHDHHTPYVIGNSDADMALAFNRMMEIGGGLVLVDGGIIRGECPLVIGGIMSDRNMVSYNRDLKDIEQYLLDKGSHPGPLVTLDFLSHTGVPFVRITPSGLYDVRNKKILFPAPV